ncbi:uncharacterized protein LOC100367849 [Saccoglossus kowalevskii]|uniref:UPF0676 protein C1494.01-like n=1 Tax=Saccoglossus kowalevskii TaxID=10224 RepID=A0ABM0GYI5_SACKO|nr:PREDICTED: UPF0676 protein C1494.01-like [Saccoglossus kowalevskii]
MAAHTIPVIDFTAYGLQRESPDEECFQELIDDVHNALKTIGFLYLTNHGIPQELIDNAFKQSSKFFALPSETKNKYARPTNDNHGYVEIGREALNPDRPGDYKELFNYLPQKCTLLLKKELPEFSESVMALFGKCKELSNRMLEIMARGLEIEDPLLFVKAHAGIGSQVNGTLIRSLWYPPIPNDEIKPNQIRCGEHSDYGSITLLFQDDVGGLQVKSIDGTFVDATPMTGSIVVNIGDLMQRWTSDKLVSTVHRVLIPETSKMKNSSRQSLTFFCHPDSSFVIKCVDGNDKYPPITDDVYLKQRFDVTYQY